MSSQAGTFSNLPSLWDRANGTGQSYSNLLGTPTPSIAFNNSSGIGYAYSQGNNTPIFEELSDSPTIEVAEQWTITHRFYVDYNTGITLQQQYYRGYRMVDSTGHISRVLSTTLSPIPKTNATVCLLTIVSEGTDFGQPPDEMAYNIIELNPVAEKHPRYSGLTYQQRYFIRQASISDYFSSQDMINSLNAVGSTGFTTNQRAQALELLYKKFKGEENFYLSAFQIQYSQYFWIPQTINPGGYIEDPFLSGNIPAQFCIGPDNNNIFENVAQWNQNVFPNYQSLTTAPWGLSWLRQTDTQVLNRTWWRVTRTWVGAPIGQWDPTWYTGNAFQAYQTSSLQGGLLVLPL